MELPLYTNLKPVNRGQRRLMEHEWNSVTLKLSAAEEVFYDLLSRADSYNDAYAMGLNLYTDIVKGLKLKYFVVNQRYFAHMYAPVDHIKIYSIIHKIHNFFR